MAQNTPGVSVYLDSGKMAQVLSKFTYVGENAMPVEHKALMAGANTVVNSAKRRVPKKTGTLSRSIHQESESDLGVVVGTDVSYARWVEEGTVKMKARPYLRPALSENKTRIQNNVAKAMREMMQSQSEG